MRVGRDSKRHLHLPTPSIDTRLTVRAKRDDDRTRKSVHKTYARALIYAKNQKQSQQLSMAPAGGLDPTELGFLTHMLADAEASNKRLRELCPQIALRINAELGRQAMRAVNSPLKRAPRIMEKVAEKYEGSFARVCDVARMTFECDDFAVARMTLEAIAACDAFDVLLIKDRMMREFDRAETGGYADALLNVRDRTNGHIAEMQITLSGLMKIKKGGGHDEYKLARILELNDEATYTFKGVLTPSVVELVRSGVIRSLECKGGVKENFDGLVAALATPTCVVHRMRLSDQLGDERDWPEDKSLADLLTPDVLKQLRPRLHYLAVKTARGDIPAEVYTCTRLETLNFAQSAVTGALSPGVGKLVNLKILEIWGSQMSGPFPTELGQLKRLQLCELHLPYYRVLDCGTSKAAAQAWGPKGGEAYASFEAGLADCVSKHGWTTSSHATTC